MHREKDCISLGRGFINHQHGFEPRCHVLDRASYRFHQISTRNSKGGQGGILDYFDLISSILIIHRLGGNKDELFPYGSFGGSNHHVYTNIAVYSVHENVAVSPALEYGG